MLKEERQQQILSLLTQGGKVFTLDLSQHLEVSEDTIRRDLKELSDQGLIKKVHGGAMLLSRNPYDFRDRAVYAQEEKKQLARIALDHLQPEQVILMDGGSSNLELARILPADLKLTVFTNSLPVANELADRPGIRTMLIGGQILPSARVTIGPEVIATLSGIRADLCILGTRSLHHEIGISEIDWDETLVKRAMVAAASDLMCLVIAEKIGTAHSYLICPTNRITTLVTNLPRLDERLLPYRRQGVDIVTPLPPHT